MSATGQPAWGDEASPVVWQSGAWALELRGDELADLTYDGVPVLRSIRAVARDRDWNTVPTFVDELDREANAVRLGLRMQGLGADLRGSLACVVHGTTLTVTLELTAHADFERNRIGLVVLHPPAVAGAGLAVRHPDGSITRTEFPQRIAPHQPALEIAGLRWRSAGAEVEARFSGDTFEMEDQRNWTDASFKTYSTPLALPFPVAVPAGTTVRQSVEVVVHAVDPGRTPDVDPVVELRSTGAVVPEFGTGASTGPDPVFPSPGSFVLVELPVTTPVWRAALARAIVEAAGRPLDVRLVGDEPAALLEPVRALVESGARVSAIGAFSSTSSFSEPHLLGALRTALDGTPLADAAMVGGARSHYTELNRGWDRLPGDADAVTFASTPQMHATETAQLVESIAMQRLTALDAVHGAGGRPVHVGPVTLRQRYGTVATAAPPPEPPEVSAGYGPQLDPLWTDPRQGVQAMRAWTIASAAAFSVPGVRSVSFFETSGPRGLVNPSGELTPAGEAMAWLAGVAGLPMWSPDGPSGDVWLIAGATRAGVTVLAANVGPRPQRRTVRIADETFELELELEPAQAIRIERPAREVAD